MSALTPTANWRMIPGHIHGLAQPALWGHISVDLSAGVDMAALDAFMASVVLPAQDMPVADTTAQGVLRHVAFWIGQVQRHVRIAISPHCHVAPSPEPLPAAADSFEVALPVSSHRATAATMVWVIKAANHCLPTLKPEAATLAKLAQEGAALLQQLKRVAEPGLNLYPQLMAAFRLGLPVARLGGRIVRLGTGAKARLMESSITDATPALGMILARDKWLTSRMLRNLGLPGTVNERVSSADDAVAKAQAMGYPVVIKPSDQDQGRGVTANLRNDAGVRAAYATASECSKSILLEKHVDGFGHRFTLCEGELIAVSKRIPGGVVGDGQHDIVALLAMQLQDPIVQRSFAQGRVDLDDEALSLLAEHGLTPQSVPTAGDFVLLRRRDNISVGGRVVHQDLAQVHPDNTLLAQRAARALYLDLAGVDILCPDISRSWREVGGAVCEVNARPQFGPGRGGGSHDRVLAKLMGGDTRIAVHLYLCSAHDEAGLVERLGAMRHNVGAAAIACAQGIWINDTPHTPPLASGIAAARAALADRDVPSLLMALTPQDVVTHGLPIDHIDSLRVAALGDGSPAALAVRERAVQWCACAPCELEPTA